MDHDLYQAQLEALTQPLHTTNTADPPDAGFTDFTAYDFGRRRRLHPDVAWSDACRAYALAAASYPCHGGHLDLQTEAQLEDMWDDLRGDAGPDWPVARTLLREAWRWLEAHPAQAGRLH